MQHKLYVLVIFVCGFLFNSCRDDMAQSNNPEDYIVLPTSRYLKPIGMA